MRTVFLLNAFRSNMSGSQPKVSWSRNWIKVKQGEVNQLGRDTDVSTKQLQVSALRNKMGLGEVRLSSYSLFSLTQKLCYYLQEQVTEYPVYFPQHYSLYPHCSMNVKENCTIHSNLVDWIHSEMSFLMDFYLNIFFSLN